MKSYLKPIAFACVLGFSFGLAACKEVEDQSTDANKSMSEVAQVQAVTLDVYKSPTCGCCADWVDHVEQAGFKTLTHHPDDLSLVKLANGIDSNMQSCHTAVSTNGYVFEGHIPAKVMQRFLDNPPADAIGLAVPGMPIGSPGMEMGDRYDDYAVMLIKKDGSTQVYEQISGGMRHE